MTQAPGAKPSAALSPFEKQVHNPSVGRSVAATCVVHELLHKGTFERFCLDPGFAKEENAFTRYLFIIFGYPGCIVSNAADSQWENNLAPSPTAQTAQTCTLAQK